MYRLIFINIDDLHYAEPAGRDSSSEPKLVLSSNSRPVQNRDVIWIDYANHKGTRGGQDHEEYQE